MFREIKLRSAQRKLKFIQRCLRGDGELQLTYPEIIAATMGGLDLRRYVVYARRLKHVVRDVKFYPSSGLGAGRSLSFSPPAGEFCGFGEGDYFCASFLAVRLLVRDKEAATLLFLSYDFELEKERLEVSSGEGDLASCEFSAKNGQLTGRLNLRKRVCRGARVELEVKKDLKVTACVFQLTTSGSKEFACRLFPEEEVVILTHSEVLKRSDDLQKRLHKLGRLAEIKKFFWGRNDEVTALRLVQRVGF